MEHIECSETSANINQKPGKHPKENTLNLRGLSKIFRTEDVKVIKLTIRPIGRHHPRSSSLPHVDMVSNVSSIFETFPGGPFMLVCQALSEFRFASPQRYQTGVLSTSISFLETGRGHRSQGANSGEYGGWGMTAILSFTKNFWVGTEV
jgi:hypothetical protein